MWSPLHVPAILIMRRCMAHNCDVVTAASLVYKVSKIVQFLCMHIDEKSLNEIHDYA